MYLPRTVMTYTGVNRNSAGLTGEDSYHGEGMDVAYQTELRVSSIHHDVSEFLYNLLEQIVFTPQEEPDRQRKGELSQLYDNYFYFSDTYYQLSRWPTVEEVSRHLKIDNDSESGHVPVSNSCNWDTFVSYYA